MKRGTHITDHLRPLAACPTQVALTDGLQIADILQWVLRQTGPAEVWQTSFSTSEEFLRRLHFIAQGRLTTALHLVLDRKATNKTLALWAFMGEVFTDVHLADNHSKVLLVRPTVGPAVSILTSQNLTRGNRHEAYLVSTDDALFDTLLDRVQDLIAHRSVPLTSILASRL